jgi:hypothetical protein
LDAVYPQNLESFARCFPPELRFGHDPVLRRLAQGIIVEQQQEITVMRQALAAMSTSSTSAHNAKEP